MAYLCLEVFQMKTTRPFEQSKSQYAIGLLVVGAVSFVCLFTREAFSYQFTAYILLATVSILAMFLELYPVLVSAAVSALVLDFFFIKPYYTLHINSAEDLLLLLLFLVIVVVNGVLTHKIRKAAQMARIRETRTDTMKLYNTLLDSLSHELRTPIATIIGALGNLQDEVLSEQQRRELLGEMDKASVRLNRQVENLLNMSRLESGFIQPKADWLDMDELLHNVVNQLSSELVGHKVTIASDDLLPLFKLDYGLTEQIFYNLIFNASQHTPKGAAITINISFSPAVDYETGGENMTCIVTVADNGDGFPEADLGKAFDKFYRSAHAKTGGTGLGLSIVKGFTEAQDGTITLENQPDGGALFTVSFAAPVLQTKEIGHD
ncbi:histidine kinase [Flavobacterium longum]|uniref:sensor histidine kinase n=1 Tax=Flavobacterium longum TaxID=1299340 RepID=UPI0039EA1B36